MPTKIKGLTGVDKVEAGAVITNPSFSGNATVSGSLTVGGVNVFSGPYRNLIINGDMRIAQRGTSVTGVISSGYRTCDRWNHVINALGTYTISQDTDVPSGQGFGHSLKIACTTADASPAAADYHFMQHRMEGQNLQHLKKGTSSAESLTLSFWVKCNQTGTLRVNLRDIDNSRHIGGSYTIDTADTWEKKTITFTGDTSGALDNDNAHSLTPEFWFDSGTDFSSGSLVTSWETMTSANRNAGATINLADSTSNYINITGVQLEVGEGASDFEFLPYDVQLARCQRYYEKQVADGSLNSVAVGAAHSTTQGRVHLPFMVTKRADPSLSFNGDWYSQSAGATQTRASSDVSSGGNNLTSAMLFVAATGLTAGNGFMLLYKTANTSNIEIDSEL